MRECLYCGPYAATPGDSLFTCPSCHLDPYEIAMIEEVREKGFARAYADEIARGRPRGVGQKETAVERRAMDPLTRGKTNPVRGD